MTTPTEPPRMKRLCDVCAGYDDDPRHVMAVGPDYPNAVPDDAFLDRLPDVSARAVAELMDPGTVVRHIDCCAERGCDICIQTRQATGDLTGKKLLAHIQSGAIDGLLNNEPAPDDTDKE